VCAGGYFAAASVYLGNAVALASFRSRGFVLTLAMGGLTAACATMGAMVLAEKRWAPRLAVVVAGGFCAMHLIGLAYLFLVPAVSDSPLTPSLQWQLGTAFLFLWLGVLGFAFRLAKGAPPHFGPGRTR
jgi:hypothetical protein